MHGEEQTYPTVEVQVVVQEQPYLVRAGVVEKLPHPVILVKNVSSTVEFVAC